MESKNAEDHKSSPIRDFRFSRSGRNQKAMAQNILEAIAQFSSGAGIATAAEDGRIRIVVKKEDLKPVLEAITGGRSLGRRESAAAAATAVVLEQRLNLLRRRQVLRAASQVKGRKRGNWRPALQSIPEEL